MAVHMVDGDCVFCTIPKKFERFHVKDYEHWGLTLFDDQRYLGRAILYLKRRHVSDETRLIQKEVLELHHIKKELRERVRLLGSERVNTAILGNEQPHVHLHWIPRYRKPITFHGQTFVDQRWGQNYAPYEPFVPSEAVLAGLKSLYADPFTDVEEMLLAG